MQLKERRPVLTCLEFPQEESVLTEQGCSDTDVDATGRAAGLQQDSLNGLAFCDGKDLICSFDKCLAHVHAVSGYHTGVSEEDVFSFSSNDIGGFPWCLETTELFRTDGDPDCILQQQEARVVRFYCAVIPCTETDKAGTDKVDGPWGRVLHDQK